MKKILFTDALTEAVISGKKTVTRRIAKPISENIDKMRYGVLRRGANPQKDGRTIYSIAGTIYRPAFKVGEVVAVAQSYKDIGLSFIQPPDPQWGCSEQMSGYGNKMFVRAELMPHQIRITDVRIERLQDISDEDCLREGVRKLESEGNPTMFTFDGWKFKNKVNRCADSPKEAFAALIDKISGKGTWERNPWVWVYDFELVK